MTSGESYDPLTWREGVDYARAGKAMRPPHGGVLPLILSLAVLIGGAAFAYATRAEGGHTIDSGSR